MLPRIIGHARLAFAYLKPEARAEAVQEVVSNALRAFVRLVELGKADVAYASPLARYGVAQVRDGRKVGASLNIRDVLSPHCQRQKNVIVERLDHFDEEENAWSEAIVEDRTAGPADIARVRCDFSDWLATLSRRNRRIAESLALGNRTTDAARKFRMSEGRISQLRRELAESWRAFVGDDPLPEAA
jgi:hypothetical protein